MQRAGAARRSARSCHGIGLATLRVWSFRSTSLRCSTHMPACSRRPERRLAGWRDARKLRDHLPTRRVFGHQDRGGATRRSGRRADDGNDSPTALGRPDSMRQLQRRADGLPTTIRGRHRRRVCWRRPRRWRGLFGWRGREGAAVRSRWTALIVVLGFVCLRLWARFPHGASLGRSLGGRSCRHAVAHVAGRPG